MDKQPNLMLDPQMEGQLSQFEISPEKVQPYLDHPERMSTFMDFKVDYAFKYILGHKRILLKLVNDILPVQVEDIEYLSNEIPVISEKEKRATFDVICTARGSGEKFLAEMQCLPDLDMADRLLYYGCSLIHRQIERGDESYLLKPVYVLCIANYKRKHEAAVGSGRFFFAYQFREENYPKEKLTDNLQYFYLELPRLQKIWDSLETNLERWCYLFGNLNNFAGVPQNPAGFEDVFNVALTGELTDKGFGKYVTSMVTEYDKRVIGGYFRQEGYEAGLAEGKVVGKVEEKRTTAKNLRELGVDVAIISQATGLGEEEILAL